MTDIRSLPLTCTHWGTYRARVSNGRVQDLLAFEHDDDPLPHRPRNSRRSGRSDAGGHSHGAQKLAGQRPPAR